MLCAAANFAAAATYYADPVNGNIANPGSQISPWKTLEEVISGGKLSLLIPGDTLLLLSGNHGSITFSGNNAGVITIAAAPGEKPQFSKLVISSGSKWTVKGITISPSFGAPYTGNIVTIAEGGTTTDVTLEDCFIYSTLDASAWTASDWMNTYSGIFQGRYINFNLGKYTDAFIYGRYKLFDEVKKDLEKLPRGSKVLDLGCGTGHLCQFIKERGYTIVGLDPSEGMLGFARQNFPDITFIEGISASLPFEDNTFDYVVSIEVLRYLNPKDVKETYKEIYRVLKPHGFFHATHVNKWAADWYQLFYFLVKFLKTMRGEKYHNCYFTSASNEKRLILNAGFKKAESIGVMFASIRIGFKLGKFFGRTYTKILELISITQHFTGAYASFAGHLIIRGYK